jgi:hypothetical protein
MILQINLMYLWRKNYQKEDYDFNSLTKQRLRIGLLFRKTKTLGRNIICEFERNGKGFIINCQKKWRQFY